MSRRKRKFSQIDNTSEEEQEHKRRKIHPTENRNTNSSKRKNTSEEEYKPKPKQIVASMSALVSVHEAMEWIVAIDEKGKKTKVWYRNQTEEKNQNDVCINMSEYVDYNKKQFSCKFCGEIFCNGIKPQPHLLKHACMFCGFTIYGTHFLQKGKNAYPNPLDNIPKDTVRKMFYDGVKKMPKDVKVEANMWMNHAEFEIVSVTRLPFNTPRKMYETMVRCKNMDRKESEQLLWHGTNSKAIGCIYYNGFDRDYNTTSNHGRGTYFTDQISSAIKGGFCGRNNPFYVLLCGVITGTDEERGTGRKPPKCVDTKRKLRLQTMQMDKGGREKVALRDKYNTMYISYRDYHAVPVFVVKFRDRNMCTNE
eukprot:415183_1